MNKNSHHHGHAHAVADPQSAVDPVCGMTVPLNADKPDSTSIFQTRSI